MVFCRKKYLIFTSYHYFQGIFREMASADFCVLLSLVSLKKLCEFADVEGVKIPLNQRLQYNESYNNFERTFLGSPQEVCRLEKFWK